MRRLVVRGLGGCAMIALASFLASLASGGRHGTLLSRPMLAGSAVTAALVIVRSRRRARPLVVGSLAAIGLLGSTAITFVVASVNDGVIPAAALTFAALTFGYGVVIAPLCAAGLGLIWTSLGAVKDSRTPTGGAGT